MPSSVLILSHPAVCTQYWVLRFNAKVVYIHLSMCSGVVRRCGGVLGAELVVVAQAGVLTEVTRRLPVAAVETEEEARALLMAL